MLDKVLTLFNLLRNFQASANQLHHFPSPPALYVGFNMCPSLLTDSTHPTQGGKFDFLMVKESEHLFVYG